MAVMMEAQAAYDGPGLRAHIGATLKLGLPLVAAQLGAMAYGVTDTIMLGWYGVETLAAGVLAHQVQMVFMLFGSGFATAVAPMVANALGADDGVLARRSLRMGLWAVIGFVALIAPVLWQSEALLRFLGQDAALSQLAQEYVRIALWALFPILIFFVLRSYLSALELTRVIMWATFAGVALNALINYALIFGNWGAPEMGIRGAAVATLLVNIFVVAATLVYMRAVPGIRATAPFARLWRLDLPVFAEVVRLGFPISLMILAETALFAGTALMMGWIGTVELAAHGIALQVISVMFMVPLGLSMAATARIGRAAGRHDRIAVRRAATAVLVLGFGFSATMMLLLVVFPEPMVAVFLDRDKPRADEILQVGAALLLVAAAFQVVDSGQVLIASVLRGVKDMAVPMVIAVACYAVIGVGACLLFGFTFEMGAIGVWWGMAISLFAAAIMLGWRMVVVLRRQAA